MFDKSRCKNYKDKAKSLPPPPPPEGGYTVSPEDREEFILAVLAFRDKHGRVPSLIEGFRIALSLGWRKS